MLAMPMRQFLRSVLVGVCVSAAVGPAQSASAGPVPNPPDQPHLRYSCGGRQAYSLASSDVIHVVGRESNSGDIYGGDRRYLACYGKHGRTSTLLKYTSPDSPDLGQIAFFRRFVAIESAVIDGTCGKYSPDPCPTIRSVASWDAKTGRRITRSVPFGPLTGLAVSPTGAIAWLEPAAAPATGQALVYAAKAQSRTVIATGEILPDFLAIGRKEVRWTDASGWKSAPLP